MYGQNSNVIPFILLKEALNLLSNFQKGFAGTQFLDGVAGKDGGAFFQGGGGCNFSKKNKIWNV